MHTAVFTPALPTIISEYDPPPFAVSAQPSSTALDIAYGGTGVILGNVKKSATPLNQPLRRRVRLYDEIGRLFIRETWSDAVTGDFAFTDLNPVYPYTLITYDFENNYRALTVDRVFASTP